MVMTIAGKKIDTSRSLWANIGARPMVTDSAPVDVRRLLADDRVYRKRLEAGDDVRDVFGLRDMISDEPGNTIGPHNVDQTNPVTPKPKGKGSAYYCKLIADLIAKMLADPAMQQELLSNAQAATHADNEGGQVPNTMLGEGVASRVQGVGDSLESIVTPIKKRHTEPSLESIITTIKGKRR